MIWRVVFRARLRRNPALFPAKVLSWLVRTLLPGLSKSGGLVYRDLETLHSSIESWNRSQGPVWTANRVKEMRLAVHRYILGMPRLTRPSFESRPNGLPQSLPVGLRLGIILRDRDVIRAVLTVLSTTRLILGGKKFDATSITDGPTTNFDFGETLLMSRFIRHFNLCTPNFEEGGLKDWQFNEFHQTMKAGPNGPALACSMWDYLSLSSKLKENLLTIAPALSYYFKVYDSLQADGHFEAVSRVFSPKPKKSLIESKISLKADREAKTRPFAILDYWSQTALKGLHTKIFGLLRKIPSDKTFNQTSLLKEFKPDPGHSYHSVDLTSATDRFPVTLQTRLLSFLIGCKRANAWRSIMCDRDFELNGSKLRYATGQPMGAYSSWAMFALTHHFVVYWAGVNAGKEGFRNYLLLGDDIVIGNDRVAEEYKKILVLLGVEYSPSKTLTSPSGFEFAKRLFINSVEYSPVPVSGLIDAPKTWPVLREFFHHLGDRGYPLKQTDRGPDFYFSLLRSFGYPERLSTNLARKCSLLEYMPLSTPTSEGVSTFARKISQFFPVSWSCHWGPERLSIILSQFAHTLHVKSIAKAARSSMDELDGWRDRFATCFRIKELSPEAQSDLFAESWKFPPISVLLRAARRSLEVLSKPRDLPESEMMKVWDDLNQPAPFVMPATRGIVPERLSEQVARSRAHFCTRLVDEIIGYHKGREPERILVHKWVTSSRIFIPGHARDRSALGQRLQRGTGLRSLRY